jgi:proline dehydrogenase
MSLFNYAVAKTIMHVPRPIVSYFAKGYIAGSTMADAVRVTRELNSAGMMTTIDILGEFITRFDQAISFKNNALELLNCIHREQLDANLSVKPTQMGLLLDKQGCFGLIRELVIAAKKRNNFIRIDMEDIQTTDATLELFAALRREFPGYVGTVLQSYLHRTPDDVIALNGEGQNYRLCKGIYIEPRLHAWKHPQAINGNFIASLELMLKQGAYVAIATHDEQLVYEGMRLVREYGLQRDRYEFQMLLGVDKELRQVILRNGHRLRIYVPYGKDWLPYSKRRLKENPYIAQQALNQMLSLKKL